MPWALHAPTVDPRRRQAAPQRSPVGAAGRRRAGPAAALRPPCPLALPRAAPAFSPSSIMSRMSILALLLAPLAGIVIVIVIVARRSRTGGAAQRAACAPTVVDPKSQLHVVYIFSGKEVTN
jgi:hypothetical protein